MSSTTTTLYLLRHGAPDVKETFYGQLDVKLSALGQAQSRAFAAALADAPLKAVYSSHLSRTKDGAALIADHHQLQVHHDSTLAEMNMGILEGLKISEARNRHPDLAMKRYCDMVDFAFPGGETMRQIHARVMPAVRGLRARHKGEQIALVAHNSVNRVIIGDALGVELEQIFCFGQDYGCINRIDYDGKDAHVALLNWKPDPIKIYESAR